eukprot:100180-Chlamydomonas_euryale.AAC.2
MHGVTSRGQAQACGDVMRTDKHAVTRRVEKAFGESGTSKGPESMCGAQTAGLSSSNVCADGDRCREGNGRPPSSLATAWQSAAITGSLFLQVSGRTSTPNDSGSCSSFGSNTNARRLVCSGKRYARNSSIARCSSTQLQPPTPRPLPPTPPSAARSTAAVAALPPAAAAAATALRGAPLATAAAGTAAAAATAVTAGSAPLSAARSHARGCDRGGSGAGDHADVAPAAATAAAAAAVAAEPPCRRRSAAAACATAMPPSARACAPDSTSAASAAVKRGAAASSVDIPGRPPRGV